jgi:putative membrane protein
MSAKLMKALRFARFGATLSLAISVPRSNPAFGFPALPAIFRRFNLARQVALLDPGPASTANRVPKNLFPRRTNMKVPLLAFATILGVYAVCLALVTSAPATQTPAASAAGASLGPADTYFVTQTSLGTPFQVDSGRLAETKGTTQAIRRYADLMVSSHIAVNKALMSILKNKAPVPPPTLLKAAYATTVSTLQHETGETFDADYVRGQVNYQKANTALYEYEIANGKDPDLKAFAQETLPKIQDHLARALKLQGDVN